jgi:miniconductance mechanosensitive channel
MMLVESIQSWLNVSATQAYWILGIGMVLLGMIGFLIARFLIARGLVYLASRTKSQFDDIIVEKLRPYRFAWLAPLMVIYNFANLIPSATGVIRQITLFLILWLVIITLNALLNAVNAIYEASESYRGTSIQVYLDLGKIVLILIGLILTVTLFTGQSPAVLLTGLGAATAVLLLIFRDTLLSFVASLQIQFNDLIREGDWIEVPQYSADGDVSNIALHTVKIQNWDKTISVIPTYKLLEVPFKNWRGMQESGGRRIKRAINIDLNSVKFCDADLIERLKQIELVKDYVAMKQFEQDAEGGSQTAINRQGFTNTDAFREYIVSYLRNRPDIHEDGMTFLVRQLAPGPTGVPLEIYVFTKTTVWTEYEEIQASIFDHLVAAINQFDLRVFQEPTGLDFQAVGRG